MEEGGGRWGKVGEGGGKWGKMGEKNPASQGFTDTIEAEWDVTVTSRKAVKRTLGREAKYGRDEKERIADS